jgi:flagellar biosynthesis anti-sigma factor FlgM
MVSEIQGPPQGLIAGIETGKPQGNNRPKLQAVPNPSGPQGDRVSLTVQAGRLQALENAIRDVPTVDRRHVEQVRQAINDGSYVFNDRRVAENLLHFEARLPSITS